MCIRDSTMVDEDKDAYDDVRKKLYEQQLKELKGEDVEEQEE